MSVQFPSEANIDPSVVIHEEETGEQTNQEVVEEPAAEVVEEEDNENKSSLSKRDKFIGHLCKIQNIITLYENKQYNDFLRKTSFFFIFYFASFVSLIH